MKKLALILAIAMIATFSAAPAFAELNIGGSYRVTATDYDPGFNGGFSQSYFQQRFRVPFTWTVNDNITAFIRSDWTEEAHWGTGNLGGSTDTIYVDYAWVKITQPMFTLTTGMQEAMLGNWSIFDSDQEGFTLALNFSPVTFTLAYGKLSENGANTDNGANDDANSFGGEFKYATDTFTIGALYARAIDDSAKTDAIGYGVFFNVGLDSVTIKGELGLYDGEASATVDYAGVNAFVDAKFSVSEAFSVGAAIFYGQGNDSATETQLSGVSVSGGSFLLYDFLGALAYDEGCYKWGTTAMQDGFDLNADDGIMAIKGYASLKATDVITLHGVLGYSEPETDNSGINSVFLANGSVDYAWMPNVTLSAGAAYIKADLDAPADDDAAVEFLARMGVNF